MKKRHISVSAGFLSPLLYREISISRSRLRMNRKGVRDYTKLSKSHNEPTYQTEGADTVHIPGGAKQRRSRNINKQEQGCLVVCVT